MGLLCSEFRLSLTVIRYGVEHCVLHENADRSTYEGGEEVNVDVIARAVEAPECVGERKWRQLTPDANSSFRSQFLMFCFLLEVAEDGDCHQQ